MKGFVPVLGSITLVFPLLLTSCGSSGSFVKEDRTNRGYNPGVGPFDSSGNYVERWADDKSKGRWWRKSTTTSSAVAKKEIKQKSKKPADIPTIAAATPPKPPISHTAQPRPIPSTASITRPTPPNPVAITPKPKPKPKPKPIAQTKPKSPPPITHIIKKGDTLYSLSRKYRTTVTAIQRANGLKGTTLHLGKKLLIPRY